MEYTYKTENTCSKIITFNLNKDIVTNVEFLYGGCPGNLQALPRLVEGLTVEEIVSKLGDINCGNKGTSCAKELAKAVSYEYEKSKQTI